jgi:hypothetical protein
MQNRRQKRDEEKEIRRNMGGETGIELTETSRVQKVLEALTQRIDDAEKKGETILMQKLLFIKTTLEQGGQDAAKLGLEDFIRKRRFTKAQLGLE